MTYFPSFDAAIRGIKNDFVYGSSLVPAGYWQSLDMSAKPEMATYELRNVMFTVYTTDMTPVSLAHDVKPNLPWAEDHFEERVSGEPLNPGEQWKKWPWGNSADKFRDAKGQFNHNYMERYWPTYAGMTPDGMLPGFSDDHTPVPNMGIRGVYGNLHDVIDLFIRDPLTRQAYVPIFFPEDTGNVNGGRVPCTLGYHFIRRNDRLNVIYYIRSCDFVRHFRDDIYLTVRLLQWMLNDLKVRDPQNWNDVLTGEFTMFITSLHMFRNDWMQVFGEPAPNHIGGINEYSRGLRNVGHGGGASEPKGTGSRAGGSNPPSGAGVDGRTDSPTRWPIAGGSGAASAPITLGDGASGGVEIGRGQRQASAGGSSKDEGEDSSGSDADAHPSSGDGRSDSAY